MTREWHGCWWIDGFSTKLVIPKNFLESRKSINQNHMADRTDQCCSSSSVQCKQLIVFLSMFIFRACCPMADGVLMPWYWENSPAILSCEARDLLSNYDEIGNIRTLSQNQCWHCARNLWFSRLRISVMPKFVFVFTGRTLKL